MGSTGGPLVVGTIADAVGLTMAAFSLAGIGVLAATTLLLFVKETLRSPPAPAPAKASSS